MLPGQDQLDGITMEKFQLIYDRAIERNGRDVIQASLPENKAELELRQIPDDRFLAEMAKCVFRAGFVWQVVENKWAGFEQAFQGFNPKAIAHFSDERLELLSRDATIIRNHKKIESVRANAEFVLGKSREFEGFGNFVCDWPKDNLVGLFQLLKKQGSRLGGHTGPYFLRFCGMDTFLFSRDVVAVLVQQGIVEKEPTSNKAMLAAQTAFNQWHDETGLPYSHLSRIMAASIESPS